MQASCAVILTQEGSRTSPIALRLEQAGFNLLHCPCISTRMLGTDLMELPHGRQLADYTIIAFTSKRAVEGVAESRYKLLASKVPIACIGEATAKVCADVLGIVPQLISQDPSADGLSKDIMSSLGEPGRLLHIRGNKSTGVLRARLTANGWLVDELVVYVNEPQPVPTLDLSGSEVALFSSPSAAQNFFAANLQALKSICCVAIGPTTASRLRELGATQVVQSPRPDLESIATTVKEAVQWKSQQAVKL